MGYDPTIGDPAWEASRAGSFLAEHIDRSREC